MLNRLDCCPERLYNITATVYDEDAALVWTSELLNPVAEGETPTTPGEVLDLRLKEPISGRILRVGKTAVNRAGSSEWMALAEVQVWGAASTPYAEQIETDLQAAMRARCCAGGLDLPHPLPGRPRNRRAGRVLEGCARRAVTATVQREAASGARNPGRTTRLGPSL